MSFETLAQSLEKEYLPLDPALIRAILSDYDHNDRQQLDTLREYLDTLRASAIADDAASFDPSGTSNATGTGDTRSSPEKSASGQSEAWERETDDTNVTNASHNLSTLSISNSSGSDADVNSYIGDLESLDKAGKVKHLGDLFPTQTSVTVEYTLRKCNGSFARTMDTLLNLVYFEEAVGLEGEEKVKAKGIDAFDEAVNPRGRKRKGKRKNGRHPTNSRSSSENPMPAASVAQNHWQLASRDIEFIASRTNIPSKTVQSLYNKNGASVKATITAIIEQDIEKADEAIPDDPVMAVNIATLASEFESLPLHFAAAIIRITNPSTAKAHELAKALVSCGSRTPDLSMPPGKIIPQYAPVRLDDDGSTKSAPMTRSSSPSSSSSTTAAFSSAALANLRSSAFNSATTYHRKAGSNRLFGGAAAYYGQLGRDYHSQLRAASAAEADSLVSAQSSADVLDLHGISVADATRITELKVGKWWDGVRMREGRSNGERVGGGLTIVTGRGTHSKEGRGRIGPAVVRMLVKDGWKVEVGSGQVVVTGKVRR